MGITPSGDLVQAKKDAQAAIRATEHALKRHLRLIKKQERIASIVATVERLRGDIQINDIALIRKHIQKLNDLTRGFAARAVEKNKKKK